MIDLLIITPIYNKAVGGAAIYYQLLVKELKDRGYKIAVISEYNGIFHSFIDNKEQYFGLFPAWASKSRNRIRDIFYYGLQNLIYFYLPFALRKLNPKNILIHSSFFNHPGTFRYANKLVYLLRHNHCNMILDVRDKMLPQNRVKHLSVFNTIIACSENVKDHLKNIHIDSGKLIIIPVIQEAIDRGKPPVKDFELKYGIKNNGFILSVGAIKKEKGIDILLEVFQKIKGELGGINLVLVGPLKAKSSEILKALRSAGIVYVGSLDRKDILDLMKMAKICVNLSRNEGMPRVSLEALSMGKLCLLPLCVPEFIRYCNEFVISSYNPDDIANDLLNVIAKREPVTCYPIHRHYPNEVVSKFIQLLKQ